MDKVEMKNLIRELLGAWDIHLGEMYLNVIFSKVDRLSDDKIEKSKEILKKYL